MADKNLNKIKEVIRLSISYVVQETLEPIKRLIKGLGFAIGAAITLGFGTLLLTLGFLRLFQSEFKVLRGTLSFVAYLIVVGIDLILGFFVVLILTKGRKSA
jgi:hypothetical protein